MDRFEITFYNRFACQSQTFLVLAKNKTDAIRLFWLKYDKKSYKDDCIEGVCEYYEPHFYTEEEILKIISN